MKRYTSEELLDIVERCQDVSVLVVGDLILDHYIWGGVDRISPEAPVVVVQVESEDKRIGGAGNVACNLARLGAKVSLCGVVGDDQSGRDLIALCEKDGIDTTGILVDRSRQTTVKSRVIAHGQQVVRIDHESTTALEPSFSEGLAALLQSKLSDAKAVIVSDYGKGAIDKTLFTRIQSAADTGKVGYNKIPVLVDPKERNFSLYKGVTIIKPNKKEASSASGIDIVDRSSALEAGRLLLERWDCEMILITLGEMGMVLLSKAENVESSAEIDTVAREVFDVSGAGDTVSAVFTLALGVSADPLLAAQLSNVAAGVVVGELGTVPIGLDQLRRAIEEGGNY